MKLPKIIDNDHEKLADVLRQLSRSHKHLSIATGYWDLPGMQLLFEEIKNYKSIRLLIGQEPLMPRHKKELKIDSPQPSFPDKDIAFDLTELPQENDYRELIKQLKLLIEEGRLKVKVYRRDFLHAKCYIFGDYDSQEAVGIIGSSNFTQAGLTANAELNALEDDYRIVKYKTQNKTDDQGHLSWFDKVWNDEKTEDWDGQFQQILENSPVGDMTYSPYEMYIKTLWEIYEDEVFEDEQLSEDIKDPLYGFQRRNAELLKKKLEKYGLAMLADSVGLGKTITAGVILKHYREEKGAKRIYVIAPASLCEQWKNDLAKHLGLYNIEILSMQNLKDVEKARKIDRYAEVDLFIVDEAHNLRSDTGRRHREFRDWFSKNQKSKVLLLTATPINNRLGDLVNQVQLAAKGSLRSFPVTYPGENRIEVLDFFEASKRLENEIARAKKRGELPDYDKIGRVMRQGLSHFLVRTTRKGAKEYGEKIAKAGKQYSFPESKVSSAPYNFDTKLSREVKRFLTNSKESFAGVDPTSLDIDGLLEKTQYTKHPLDMLSDIEVAKNDEANTFINLLQAMSCLGFVLYRPETYKKRFYGKSDDEVKSIRLPASDSLVLRSQMGIHNMLRVSFLKRLESSVYALKRSLEKYESRLNTFASNLKEGFIIPVKDYQIVSDEFGDDLEAVGDNGAINERQRIDQNLYNMDALWADIAKDQAIIQVLLKTCRIIEKEDDKLKAFVDLFNQLVKTDLAGNKILVFSYYADTIAYLENRLPQLIQQESFQTKAAFVSGHKSKSQTQTLVGRFAPRSQGVSIQSSEELDYLFSTDILSEGQNLQDCGILVNFDLHWNPVRMIQRNGRINRLGSEYQKIFINNMHPETHLETYLKLVQRLEQKIDDIKHTIGTDQSVLGEEAKPIEYIDQIEGQRQVFNPANLYDSQRAEQTYELAVDDNEQLLGINEYVHDLRYFLDNASQQNKLRVKNIPLGKWGYMPCKDSKQPTAMALICIKGKIRETNNDFKNHIFIEIIPSKGGVRTSVLETLKALFYLRTNAADNRSYPDHINYDRAKVKRYTLSQAKIQAVTDESIFKPTKSQMEVLNRLRVDEPSILLASKLKLIATKQDETAIKILFREASQQLKRYKYLNPNIIAGFKDFEAKLDTYTQSSKELTDAQGVLFYARQ